MQIEVNGAAREVPTGTTVLGLLELLELSRGPVAVERNEQLIPRAQHSRTELRDGDRLEVVQFVGGG